MPEKMLGYEKHTKIEMHLYRLRILQFPYPELTKQEKNFC